MRPFFVFQRWSPVLSLWPNGSLGLRGGWRRLCAGLAVPGPSGAACGPAVDAAKGGAGPQCTARARRRCRGCVAPASGPWRRSVHRHPRSGADLLQGSACPRAATPDSSADAPDAPGCGLPVLAVRCHRAGKPVAAGRGQARKAIRKRWCEVVSWCCRPLRSA
jgi:hypothetical protein